MVNSVDSHIDYHAHVLMFVPRSQEEEGDVVRLPASFLNTQPPPPSPTTQLDLSGFHRKDQSLKSEYVKINQLGNVST